MLLPDIWKKVSDFLRNLTPDEVIGFYRAREDLADSAGLIDVPNLIPDGIIIPKNGIYNAFKDANIHDKAMIFGSNRDENKLFMYQNEKFVKFLPKFITTLIPFFKNWSKPIDPEFYDIYAKYQAQSWKHGAVDLPARFMSNDKSSPIYGMPVLDVEKSGTVLFVKRSMATGYSGVDNELFYRNNTTMLFGDAKKMCEGIVKALG